MLKYIGTFITFLILPILLFVVAYFGIKIFAQSSVLPNAVPSTSQTSDLCGNAICERAERAAQSCAEDC